MPTASPKEQKFPAQRHLLPRRGENYSNTSGKMETGLVEKQKMQKIISEVQRCSQVAAPLKKA